MPELLEREEGVTYRPQAPKIVVVDDEPSMCQCVADTLERAGFAVITSTDPRAAAEIVRREKPDLVLVDISMPSMSGYSFVSGLRLDPEAAQCPVAFLTGSLEFRERMRAFRFGVSDYLTKPFSRDKLIASVRRIVEERQQKGVPAGTPSE